MKKLNQEQKRLANAELKRLLIILGDTWEVVQARIQDGLARPVSIELAYMMRNKTPIKELDEEGTYLITYDCIAHGSGRESIHLFDAKNYIDVSEEKLHSHPELFIHLNKRLDEETKRIIIHEINLSKQDFTHFNKHLQLKYKQ